MLDWLSTDDAGVHADAVVPVSVVTKDPLVLLEPLVEQLSTIDRTLLVVLPVPLVQEDAHVLLEPPSLSEQLSVVEPTLLVVLVLLPIKVDPLILLERL